MSQKLRVYTTRDAETGMAHVFWYAGSKKFGRLDIQIPPNTPDAEVTAELIGLRHLLIDRSIYGTQQSTGIVLCVSKGAIRKISKNQSSKKHLMGLGTFLRTRFVDAEIEVDKPNEDHLEHWESVTDPETVEFQHGPAGNIIDTPAAGKIEITAHAVEQYTDRIKDGELKRVWKSLTQCLTNPGLKDADTPAKVRAHKLKKYPFTRGQRIMKHPDGTMHYVLVPEGDRMILVTTFDLHGTQRHVYGG